MGVGGEVDLSFVRFVCACAWKGRVDFILFGACKDDGTCYLCVYVDIRRWVGFLSDIHSIHLGAEWCNVRQGDEAPSSVTSHITMPFNGVASNNYPIQSVQ